MKRKVPIVRKLPDKRKKRSRKLGHKPPGAKPKITRFAMAIIFNDQGQIMVGTRASTTRRNPKKLAVPGGRSRTRANGHPKIEPIEYTLIRETREETGLPLEWEITPTRKTTVIITTDPRKNEVRAYHFIETEITPGGWESQVRLNREYESPEPEFLSPGEITKSERVTAALRAAVAGMYSFDNEPVGKRKKKRRHGKKKKRVKRRER